MLMEWLLKREEKKEKERRYFYDRFKKARLSLILRRNEVTMGWSERLEVSKRIKFVPRVTYTYRGVFQGAAIKLENLWVVPWLPWKPRKQQPLHRKENSLQEFRSLDERERPRITKSNHQFFQYTLLIFEQHLYHFSKLTDDNSTKYLSIYHE